MKNSSQLLKFTTVCMQLATQQVPLYSSKFPKHTFTQPQLVVLYCLKIKLGVTYRDLIDWLAEMPRIQQALGLKQLPHFTTVQKAFERLSTAVWRCCRGSALSLEMEWRPWILAAGIAAMPAATTLMDQAPGHKDHALGGHPGADGP